MKLVTSIGIALAVAPAVAIPPENFGFPSSSNNSVLDVAYRQSDGSYTRVQPGNLFGINVPAEPPVLILNFTSNEGLNGVTASRFLALVVDPDASYPENPQNRFILHYLQLNLLITAPALNDTVRQAITPQNGNVALLTSREAPTVSYNRPRPPTNSSAHRYIFYLFAHSANFTIPEAFAGYNAQNRSRFDLAGFVAASQLGNPLAANYFYASNQSSVPADFVAAPGGSYPQGNGNAVTSGDPGATALPSRTNTQTSPTTNAAAMVTGVSGLLGAGIVGLAALL